MDYTTPIAPPLSAQSDRRRRTWLRPAAFGLAIGFACGFAAHALWGSKPAPLAALPAPPSIAEAIEEVRDNYVEPRDESALLDDAIRGVMSGLDEHSVYLD